MEGDITNNDLKVNVMIKSPYFDFSNFYISDFETTLNLAINKTIEFSRLKCVVDNEGEFSGVLNYSYNSETAEFNYKLSNVNVSDLLYHLSFPTNMDGKVYINFNGGYKNGFYGEHIVNIRNSEINGNSLGESFFKYDISNETHKIVGAFFDDSIDLNLLLDTSSKKKSHIEINSYTTNGINILRTYYEIPRLKFKNRLNLDAWLRTSFYYNKMKELDLDFNLKNLVFEYDNILLDTGYLSKKIDIKKGKINNWNILADGIGLTLSSKGQGNIANTFSVKNNLRVDASLLSILSENIKNLSGSLFFLNTFEKGEEKTRFKINGNKVSFDYRNYKNIIRNLNFNLSIFNDNIHIKKLDAHFFSGDMIASGVIEDFVDKRKMNIDIRVDQANYKLTDFSYILFDSRSKLISEASQTPTLKGDVVVHKSNILDNFNNLQEEESTRAYHDNIYLPKGKQSYLEKIKLQLNTNFINNILVKNDLLDTSLNGSIVITGTTNNISADGVLSKIGKGKIFIKNNEFNLSKLNLNFDSSRPYDDPIVDVSGLSRLGDYQVSLNVNGQLSNPMIDFSSKPFLTKENIFSLLTLGYTEDVSGKIGHKDKQHLTSVNLGNLLIEKLRIRNELKENFGLKLSLLPEFETNDESNLLNDTSGASAGGGRLRSSTKVKVEKKVYKKVNMSVSSIVGGNKQKQEMNLDYQFNNNFSLKGIYEVRTGEKEEFQNSSTGADVNFRWTFK